MIDIVERLRLPRVQDSITETYAEAADEIERLRAALAPFAKYELHAIGLGYAFATSDFKKFNWIAGFDGPQPEYRHFDAARQALATRVGRMTQ